MAIPVVIPCMGGFCALRDKCQHHTKPTTRKEPAERLCDRGREQTMHFAPAPTYTSMPLPSQRLPSQQVGE